MNDGFLGWTIGGHKAQPYVTNKLAADVTLTTVNVYVDGPQVTLGPGIWWLAGSVTVSDSASAANITAKIWDGVTVETSGESQVNSAGSSEQLALTAVVQIYVTTTYRIAVVNGTNSTTGRIRAAAPQNSAGNNASFLNALKIG